MSENKTGLTLDTRQAQLMRKYFSALAAAGPRVVAKAINRVAFRWAAEIQRHIPVDTGLARNSVTVRPADPNSPDGKITAVVGSNAEHVPYLEFGWDAKAGNVFALVKKWQFGDQPVLDWKAKRADASAETAVKVSSRGRGQNPTGRFTSARATSGAEFMPPFRGSWQVIQDDVVKELRAEIIKALQDEAKSLG